MQIISRGLNLLVIELKSLFAKYTNVTDMLFLIVLKC